jgi:cell division protein FtsB
MARKRDMEGDRQMTYVGVFVVLFMAYLWTRGSAWQGSKDLHTIMEVTATLLALETGIRHMDQSAQSLNALAAQLTSLVERYKVAQHASLKGEGGSKA